jgi:hypothetical protein
MQEIVAEQRLVVVLILVPASGQGRRNLLALRQQVGGDVL